MKIDIVGSDATLSFNSDAGARILYEGLESIPSLPYECATGTCGSCKAKRISGDFAWVWPDAPARKDLKTADDFLLCQCEATSDLKAEVRAKLNAPQAVNLCANWYDAQIIASENVAPGVMCFSVKLGQTTSFVPGQFMVLEFEGIVGGRAWSMTNFAEKTDVLDFVIKKKPDGALSDFIFAQQSVIGLKARVFGPLGRAVYQQALNKDILCIAGGSGVAGMMSILSAFVHFESFKKNKANLFFGVRTTADAFFLQELSELVVQAAGAMRVVIALSDAPATPELIAQYPHLQFGQGFVHEVAIQHMDGQFTPNTRAFLAGPPPCVNSAMRTLLMQAKLPATEILYDKFN
jgi:toluene monooxygenase electron transfer component